MRKKLQLAIWSILLASLVSCTGLKVTGCTIDAENNRFQCYSKREKKSFLVPFDHGDHLLCASPDDTEAQLKACAKKINLAVTLCKWSVEFDLFECQAPTQLVKFQVTPEHISSYFCMSARDRARMAERCQ